MTNVVRWCQESKHYKEHATVGQALSVLIMELMSSLGFSLEDFRDVYCPMSRGSKTFSRLYICWRWLAMLSAAAFLSVDVAIW